MKSIASSSLFSFAMVLMALFVGYGLGKRGEPVSDSLHPFEKTEQETVDYKEKYLALQSRFDQLNKVDFEEYLQLKTQKEKYNKANDILGKILVIFLAELGLKVSGEARDYAEDLMSNPDKHAYKEKETSGNKSPQTEKNIVAEVAKQNHQTFLRKETKVHEVKSKEEAQDFLDAVHFENLFDELRAAQGLKKRQYVHIRGSFIGFVNLSEPKGEQWEVELFLDGQLVDGVIRKGTSRIKLLKDGQVFSDSNGNGDIDGVKSLAGKKKGILLKLGGNNGYFQLYYAPALNQLIGNYYKEISVGSFKRKGTVFLERR